MLCHDSLLCCAVSSHVGSPGTHLRDAAHAAGCCRHHLDARPADAEQQAAAGHFGVQGLLRRAPRQAHNRRGAAIDGATHAAADRREATAARVRCLLQASSLTGSMARRGDVAMQTLFTGRMRLLGCWAHPHSASPGKRQLSCKRQAMEVGSGERARRLLTVPQLHCYAFCKGSVVMRVGCKVGEWAQLTSSMRGPRWMCVSLMTSQVRGWALAPPLSTSSPSGGRHSAEGQAGRQACGQAGGRVVGQA